MRLSPPIIGFTGTARSGKDTCADVLVGQGYVKIAFANALKECARQFFRWDGAKDDRGRRLLQLLGTEIGRAYNENIWIEHVQAQIGNVQILDPHARVVIPDVRFPNEAAWIRSHSGVVLRVVGRGGLEGAASRHTSETAQSFIAVEGVVRNTGTLDALPGEISAVLHEISAGQSRRNA